MEEIKRRLMALPIYAADWQEAEMQLLPQYIREKEVLEAAVSVSYQQIRSLLILTNERILVLNAGMQPVILLDLPIEHIERTYASMWYSAGNVNCYTSDEEYCFLLMSTAVYVPLAKLIETMAEQRRQQIREES